MHIRDNPFFILKASTRDRKARLIELAEERSLDGDQEATHNARTTLINVRNRLSAEIAWLAGLAPKRALALADEVVSGKQPDLDGLPFLASANLLADTLFSYAQLSSKKLVEAISTLSELVGSFDSETIQQSINEDRQVAGVPAVPEVRAIEDEIAVRLRYYQSVITEVMSGLPSDVMVMAYTQLITEATGEGEYEAGRLIYDVIDAYELRAKGSFLDHEAEAIVQMIDATRKAADGNASPVDIQRRVQDIIQALRGWDRVAQPIQVARKSQGLAHDDSHRLGFSARSLAVDLCNEHDYLQDAQMISRVLRDLFQEVPGVVEKIDEDIDALTDIEKSRHDHSAKKQKEADEWARDITYETALGMVFKDKFRISPDGIDYNGVITPLGDVTGVSWGAIKHSTNGIPTGTTYHICWVTPRGIKEIKPNQVQFQAIADKLWRAVCVSILLRWIEIWRKGEVVRVGGVEVHDDGILLTKSKLFGSETKVFSWFEIQRGTNNGFLRFNSKNEKGFSTSFSYKDVMNTHILSFATDKIWEGKARRLSEILDK